MKDKFHTIAGWTIVFAPIIAWLYAMYLSITMFLIPAFKLYFSMYGVFGTFGIWFALSATGWLCGYSFMRILTYKPPQATYKENTNA